MKGEGINNSDEGKQKIEQMMVTVPSKKWEDEDQVDAVRPKGRRNGDGDGVDGLLTKR